MSADREPTTEHLVLARCFWANTDELTAILGLLSPRSFQATENRTIYRAMCQVVEHHGLVDEHLLATALEREGRLEEVGGRESLVLLKHTDNPAYDGAALAQELYAEETRRAVVDAAQKGSTTEEILRAVQDVALDRGEAIAASARRSAVSLREALETAEGGEKLEPLIERLVYPGRVTLLAAREKLGKSTLAAAAMAARSAGFRFLNRAHDAGPVLYWFGAKEGHRDDVAPALEQFGADPDQLHLLEEGASPFIDLEAEVARLRPEVIVIDTLSAFVGAMEMESADKRWDSIMGRFARLARESGAGILILHHARKSDGKYRDSTAIGGGVDVILEMSEGEVHGVRKVDVHTRRGIRLDDYSVRFVDAADGFPPYFELAADTLSIDSRVLLFVEQNPGCSKRDVRKAVKGGNPKIDDALSRLVYQRALRLEDSGGRHAYYSSRVPNGKPQGHALDTPSARSGHGASEHGTSACPDGGEVRSTSPSGTVPRLPKEGSGIPAEEETEEVVL